MIVVLGSRGQLGSDILDVLGKDAFGISHREIEIKNIDDCKKILKDADLAINCAAYINVDDCEDHPEEAFMVNAIGARNVASICGERDITNIYISTDFVFDGTKFQPYSEEDNPSPINVYGLTKFAGEVFTKNYCKKFYIIRTSSLFGIKGARGKGGNFVEWMIKKAKDNEEIKVVDDIIMSPTNTKDIAKIIKMIIKKDLPYGVYHLVNGGFCSWFGFAKKIFEFLDINARLFPIKSQELQRKASRPKFSALENKKLNSLGFKIRNWDCALNDYLVNKGYLK
jgi:dTDP-4-dehydrorhamnose reductase